MRTLVCFLQATPLRGAEGAAGAACLGGPSATHNGLVSPACPLAPRLQPNGLAGPSDSDPLLAALSLPLSQQDDIIEVLDTADNKLFSSDKLVPLKIERNPIGKWCSQKVDNQVAQLDLL